MTRSARALWFTSRGKMEIRSVTLPEPGPRDVLVRTLFSGVSRGTEALVLRGGVPMGTVPPPYDFTWAFVVREQPDGTTRLLVRERYGYTRRWAPLLVEPVAVVAFVMTQRMLRGIRDRAEQGGRPTA